MKKLLALLVMASMAFAGCGSSTSSTSSSTSALKMLVPTGAPAMAMLSAYSQVKSYKLVDGADLLSAEMIKSSSDYDVIVAPINLGCKLIAAGKTDYKLGAVITWGNLYVVENKSVTNNKMAAFGEAAVPGQIIKSLDKKTGILKKRASVKYYNAVTDVQAQMLSGKYQYGLMAEPAATATIAKAKTAGKSLSMYLNVQAAYTKAYNLSHIGYPQAAIFVKDASKTKELLSNVKSFTDKADSAVIKKDIDSIGAAKLGVPNSTIITKTWSRMNISYKNAADCTSDVKAILKTFGVPYKSSMLAK